MNQVRDVAFLTGAGVSVDSGIPDFRTNPQKWKFDLPREEVFSRSFFKQNPQKFWDIFKETFVWDNKFPNVFHKLPEMLAASGRRVDVLTQNVDGFHGTNKEFMSGKELSDDGYTLLDTSFENLSVDFNYGSLSVFEAHGNKSRVVCLGCFETQPLQNVFHEDLPRCKKCEKVLKPDVSLFGEGVSGFSDGVRAVINCDVLIVAGTSLQVGPVNELPLYMKQNMKPYAKSVWVNKQEPPSHYDFDEVFVGECSDFPEYFWKNLL